MHPAECPNWEYNDVDGSEAVLKKNAKAVLLDLRSGRINTSEASANTRPIHKFVFSELTPPDFEYYAGNYRGESFRCLKYYEVKVGGDPRVGYPAKEIFFSMQQLGEAIKTSIKLLDRGVQQPEGVVPLKVKIQYVVAVACRLFEWFLRIHPYANGNGHMARFCIWAILGRYDLWPNDWPIEPRPKDPPYTQLIIDHRNGRPHGLEMFVMQCLSN